MAETSDAGPAQDPSGDRLFRLCAAGALALHAWLLFGTPGLHGGADLLPHLRLVQRFAESPGFHSVYAPAYHALGALLAPVLGLESYPRWFGLLGAVCWIGGFRRFQRAAGLPGVCAALFALNPYAISLSWALPKVELVGYGMAFFAMGLLVERRYAALAGVLAATFWVHTASALFLGLAAGLLALASRDVRGLGALALGSLGAVPLVAIHTAAGCSVSEALMFSRNDYLRATVDSVSVQLLDRIVLLANPILVVVAGLGARALWRRSRPLAFTAAGLTVVYLNEVWLGFFTTRTALDLLRGLSVLALPVAVSAGVFLGSRPRWRAAIVGVSAVWALGCAVWVVPRTWHVRNMDLAELRGLEVARCAFRWRGPAIRRPARAAPPSPPPGAAARP